MNKKKIIGAVGLTAGAILLMRNRNTNNEPEGALILSGGGSSNIGGSAEPLGYSYSEPTPSPSIINIDSPTFPEPSFSSSLDTNKSFDTPTKKDTSSSGSRGSRLGVIDGRLSSKDTGFAPNTYDEASGTYTDRSGLGYSTAFKPSGASSTTSPFTNKKDTSVQKSEPVLKDNLSGVQRIAGRSYIGFTRLRDRLFGGGY